MIQTTCLSELKLCAMALTKQNIADILRPMFRNSCDKVPFSLDLSENDLSGARGRLVAQLIQEAPMARRDRLTLNYCSMGDEVVRPPQQVDNDRLTTTTLV